MVGEQLRYVAEYRGQWMALIGWSAGAYHLKGRDGWIGWDANQRRARLHLMANNARFCRLGPKGQYPNLASRALALNLERLSADWQAKYGHPIVVVESFVDEEWFRGTENCVYRVLKAVPVRAFQAALWAWQKARHGAADGGVVVLDGKALRGSGKTQLVGAINAQSGRTLGVEAVADKSNEIPAAQTLLERLDLEGTIALMDAMHTQVETARSVVQEGGGDYVLFVKGNQDGLLKQARHFLREDFSPSTAEGGAGARADRVAGDCGQGGDPRPDGFSTRGAGGAP